MTGTDLLERRAERGVPRGPAIVWADAQNVDVGEKRDRRANYRVSAWFAIVALSFFAATQIWDGEPQARSVEIDPNNPALLNPSEPLPTPILLDGFRLTSSVRPANPDFDSDDIFGEGPSVDEDVRRFFPRVETTVFGDPDRPFENPILAVESPVDRSFVAINAANAGPEQLLGLTRQVEVAAPSLNLNPRRFEVTLPPETGLDEIAQVSESGLERTDFAWTFIHETGTDGEIILTARTAADIETLTVWSDIAPQLAVVERRELDGTAEVFLEESDSVTTLIEVLGQPAIHVTSTGLSPFVVWQNEGFVYSLTVRSENEFQGTLPIEQVIDELLVVERSEWIQTVAGVDLDPTESSRLRTVLLETPLVWFVVGLVGWLIGLRRRKTADI